MEPTKVTFYDAQNCSVKRVYVHMRPGFRIQCTENPIYAFPEKEIRHRTRHKTRPTNYYQYIALCLYLLMEAGGRGFRAASVTGYCGYSRETRLLTVETFFLKEFLFQINTGSHLHM
jgi:hypothetical protein